jgi:DNA-binding CsgD family transcriptional regulator
MRHSIDVVAPAGISLRTLELLFSSLGRANFCESLGRLAHEVSGADHCGAFLMQGEAPTCVAVASVVDAQVPLLAAKRYIDRHWRSDRAWKSISTCEGARLHHIRVKDIPEKTFRRDCFEANGVVDKMTVASASSLGAICVSVFRCGQYFEPDAVQAFAAAGALLVSLVQRHVDLTTFHRPPGVRLISKHEATELVGATCPELSGREREVCGRILAGMSSEAIALDLSVQFGTILTYRKRAYARLGITSQSELFAICLRAARLSDVADMDGAMVGAAA